MYKYFKRRLLKWFDDDKDYNKDYVNSSDSETQTSKETSNLTLFDDYT